MSVNGSTSRENEHDVVVRKAEQGWVVRGENVPDLTSAMVLADLFAADQTADDDTRLFEAVDQDGAPRKAPERGGGRHRIGRLGGNKGRGKDTGDQHGTGQHAAGRPPAPRSAAESGMLAR